MFFKWFLNLYFFSFKFNLFSSLLDQYETIVFHKNVARVQREAYKNHHTVEKLRNNILIEMDFKQKIKIGLSPRQPSPEYYEQKDVTYLGT